MMRVLITGGTGFIGYHTTLALLEEGHEVVLLVRNLDKMRKLYGDRIEHYVVGDITDPDAVNKAMDGADAVVSIAALVSTGAKDADLVYETNVSATKLIIGGAVERGISRIIHVSSVTALYDANAGLLDENSPPGTATTPYGRSKAACERYVRGLQAEGAPISITYPATVIGPDSPEVTEAHDGIRIFLGSIVPVLPSGNQYVDVRDIAEVHKRLLDPNAPPGRYILGGHFLTWREQVALLNELTGRQIRTVPLPGSIMRGMGRFADAVNRVSNMDLGLSYEGTVYATNWKQMDNSRTERDMDFTFRDVSISFTDTIRWLYDTGHIDEKQLGALKQGKIAP